MNLSEIATDWRSHAPGSSAMVAAFARHCGDKSLKRTHTASRAHDAEFINLFQAFSEAHSPRAAPGTSVSIPPSISLNPKDQDQDQDQDQDHNSAHENQAHAHEDTSTPAPETDDFDLNFDDFDFDFTPKPSLGPLTAAELAELEALLSSLDALLGLTPEPELPSTPPKPSFIEPTHETPAVEPLGSPLEAKSIATRKPMPPWWKRSLPLPPRPWRTIAQHRDVTEAAWLFWWHQTLTTTGPTYPFTLRLSFDVEAKAKAVPSAVTWLHARIARRLNQALGRKVEFWIVLEEDEAHALHVHGEFGVSEPELEDARKAMRNAGGEWPAEKARQHQCRTDADLDAGWPSYCAKDLWRTSEFSRHMCASSSPFRIEYKGSATSATAGLKANAVTFYNARRDELSEAYADSHAGKRPGSITIDLSSEITSSDAQIPSCTESNSSVIVTERQITAASEGRCFNDPSQSKSSLTCSTTLKSRELFEAVNAIGSPPAPTLFVGTVPSSKTMSRSTSCSSVREPTPVCARGPPRLSCKKPWPRSESSILGCGKLT